MVVSMVCIVFLFVVLGVCQFFTQFDADRETARAMREHSGPVLALRKGYLAEDDLTATLDMTRRIRVTEEDISAFREAGYKGGVFPLYGVAMMTHNAGANVIWEMDGFGIPPDAQNYKTFYCHTGIGVLQATEEYLIKLYGKDGKLNVLSGEITSEGDGVVVTDYFADSILTYDPAMRLTDDELAAGGDKYAKIAKGNMLYARYRVAAVIQTGYKERYAPLLEALQNGKELADMGGDLAVRFYEELGESLNLAYSVNPGFSEAYNANMERRIAYFGAADMETDGKRGSLSPNYAQCDKKLQPDEIKIDEDVYRDLIGAQPGDDLQGAVGKRIRIKFGDLYAETYNVESEFTIAGLFPHKTTDPHLAFYVSPEVHRELLSYSAYAYALYFDNVDSAMQVYETGTERGFTVLSPLVSAMVTVSRASGVFIDLFEIIIWALYALAALTLAGFAAGSVRKCVYEIGVVRAMGAKTHNLAWLFVLQMVLVSAGVCLVAGLGLWLGADLCNAALADGFASVTKNAAMRGIAFIRFSWTTVLFDAGVIFGLTALLAVIPLLILRRIKPREIIRAKE